MMNGGKVLLKSFTHNLLSQISKHAPAICAGVGATGIGIGAVKICKDTYKNYSQLSYLKDELEEKHYKVVAKETTKIYWKSAAIIGGSVGLMLVGHGILDKRYVQAVSACTILHNDYRKYRDAIRDDYGEAVDIAANNGLRVVGEVDDGYDLNARDVGGCFIPDRDLSSSSVFFGNEYSMIATDDSNTNLHILQDIQNQANDMFNEKGYLYLQDVYYMLGLTDKTAPDGIGWCKGLGDNYISFGIMELHNARAVDGLESVFLLDFNHDGFILPHI